MEGPIAVPVERGADPDGPLHSQFGRAPVFLVFRPGRDAPESIENGAAGEAHGAGTGAAALVARHGAVAVISGRFGPKAAEALLALRVAIWLAPAGMTVRDAVERCRRGELERFEVRRY
jgi:predicted Fe-Mo cluster-binding NifX family protein